MYQQGDILNNTSKRYVEELAAYEERMINKLLRTHMLDGRTKEQLHQNGFRLVRDVEGNKHTASIYQLVDAVSWTVEPPKLSRPEVTLSTASEGGEHEATDGSN